MSELTLSMMEADKAMQPKKPLAIIDTTNHHQANVTFLDREACARCAKAGLVSGPKDGVFQIKDDKPFMDNMILNGQYRRWVENGRKVEKVGK